MPKTCALDLGILVAALFVSCGQTPPPKQTSVDLEPIIQKGDGALQSMTEAAPRRDYQAMQEQYLVLVDCYARLADELETSIDSKQEARLLAVLSRWEPTLKGFREFRKQADRPLSEPLPESDPSKRISAEELAKLEKLLEPDPEEQALRELERQSVETSLDEALEKVRARRVPQP